MSMSLKDKLALYKSHITTTTNVPLKETGPSNPSCEAWNDLCTRPFAYGEESIMVREIRYPLSYRHGRYAFCDLFGVLDAWNQSEMIHPLSGKGRLPRDLLFFDTETTGLQGGTGNIIFLLGVTFFEEDAVVMRQHILTDSLSETALYHSFLSDLDNRTHVVTYNGKSFDWPQVKTRHTLHRDSLPALPTFGHYDLLHAARRLWRDDLESCRLTLIEPAKLSVFRSDDVPGSMAPIQYFEFLRTKNPQKLAGVLRHNEMDVLSLITLYIHVSNLILHAHHDIVASTEEQFQIARWFAALGHVQQATSLFQQVVHADHPLSVQAQTALGYCHKKQRNWESAIKAWEQAIQDTHHAIPDIYIELSKIYEHHVKDNEKALYYALEAFSAWKKRAQLLRRGKADERQSHQKRVDRLTHKVIRS